MISLIYATMNGPIHFQMSCKEMQNAADIAFFLSDRTLSPHVSAAAEVIFPLLLVLTSASSLLVPHHSLVEPSRPKEFLNVCAVGRLHCLESTGFTIDFVNGIDLQTKVFFTCLQIFRDKFHRTGRRLLWMRILELVQRGVWTTNLLQQALCQLLQQQPLVHWTTLLQLAPKPWCPQ